MDIFLTIAFLILIILTIASIWMVFQKAGESGWKAVIPVYNNYVMLRISGHSGWWILLLLVPILIVAIAMLSIDPTSFAQQMNAANGGGAGWLGIAMNAFFISVQVMWIVATIMLYDLARSFGRGLGFTIGMTMLPFVFWPILGFGDDEYRGPAAHPKMVAAGTGAHIEKEEEEKENEDDDKSTDDEHAQNEEEEEESSESEEN